MTIAHTYTLNTRVRCVCDPHTGAGLEMSSKGLWETEKTGNQYTKGNRVSTPSFRVGVMQEMESEVKGQEGVQTACTSRPRSGGAMNKSTLAD